MRKNTQSAPSVWTTSTPHNMTSRAASGSTAPQDYQPQLTARPPVDVTMINADTTQHRPHGNSELPYGPPPMPGYYAPLPPGAPPPFNDTIGSQNSGIQGERDTHLPRLSPQSTQNQEHTPHTVEKGGKNTSQKKNKCLTCWKVMSFIGHIGCLASVIGIIWTLLTPPLNGGLIVLCVLVIFLGYMCILLEAKVSNARGYLRNLSQEETVRQYVDRMQQSSPSITWTVQCWHLNTVMRSVNETDSKGNVIGTRLETIQEPEITFTETRNFEFSQWRDVSPPIPHLTTGVATRIALYKTFTFSDEMSMRKYSQQKDEFYESNRHRDEFIDFYENFEINGYKERVTAYIDEASKSACMSHGCFWTTAVIFCTYPYRCWFRRVTNKAYYTIIKEFGL